MACAGPTAHQGRGHKDGSHIKHDRRSSIGVPVTPNPRQESKASAEDHVIGPVTEYNEPVVGACSDLPQLDLPDSDHAARSRNMQEHRRPGPPGQSSWWEYQNNTCTTDPSKWDLMTTKVHVPSETSFVGAVRIYPKLPRSRPQQLGCGPLPSNRDGPSPRAAAGQTQKIAPTPIRKCRADGCVPPARPTKQGPSWKLSEENEETMQTQCYTSAAASSGMPLRRTRWHSCAEPDS